VILHLDWETFSRVDLLKQGVYNYAKDPSTGIHCAGWAIDEDPAQIWLPGDPVPEPIIEVFERGDPRTIYAHNAAFERLIAWFVFCVDYDVPEPPLEAFYCTATQARRRALPGGLENLGRALKLNTQKSLAGKQLIRKLCIPWRDGKIDFENGVFNRDPGLLNQLYDYCEQDVEVERAAALMSPPLTDEEFADYVMAERINDRGLMVDFELAAAAAEYAKEETDEIGQELSRLTDGKITRPRQFKRVKEYFEPYMKADDELRKMMTRYKTDRKTGETTKKITLDKTARKNILASEHEFNPHITPIIELLDEAGRASTSKFTAMCMRADLDDIRVRGAYICNGAVQTGRFSSVGLQVHNFTRDCAKDPEAVREQIIAGDLVHGVMDTLASMLRPAIIAPEGKVFVCGDFSSVEAIGLPWLAKAGHILDEYRESFDNPDLPDAYEREAARLRTDDRQIGKVATLSMGFGGGAGAFISMALNYDIVVEVPFAEKIKKSWRAANPWAPKLWYGLEGTARAAMKHPGEIFTFKRLSYVLDEEWDVLWCILPSGKTLAYPQPRLDNRETLTCIKANWTPGQDDPEWPRVNLYGGLLSENCDQAICAELLLYAMHRMEDYDWPIVGHTHDEILCEVDENDAADCEKHMRWAMKNGPDWAEGFPLNCDIWTGTRYRK